MDVAVQRWPLCVDRSLYSLCRYRSMRYKDGRCASNGTCLCAFHAGKEACEVRKVAVLQRLLSSIAFVAEDWLPWALWFS